MNFEISYDVRNRSSEREESQNLLAQESFSRPEKVESVEKVEKNLHSVSREVSASPEEVWKAIGKFDALPWHPGIESGKVQTKCGVTTRSLVAKGGSPVFEEQLLEQGPHHIKYKMIGGLPLQPEGTLKVESNGHGGSKITWEAKIDGADKKMVEAVTAGVTGFYAAGLDNLVKKFDKKK